MRARKWSLKLTGVWGTWKLFVEGGWLFIYCKKLLKSINKNRNPSKLFISSVLLRCILKNNSKINKISNPLANFQPFFSSNFSLSSKKFPFFHHYSNFSSLFPFSSSHSREIRKNPQKGFRVSRELFFCYYALLAWTKLSGIQHHTLFFHCLVRLFSCKEFQISKGWF